MPNESFNVKKFFSGFINPTTWSKSIIYFVMIWIICLTLYSIKQTFFPTKNNVNKPITYVAPFAKVEKVDNTNTQISVEKEKPFEVGAGVGGIRYDNKDGAVVGLWGKWKF